jgi:tRNA(fMet)-specific endonuclease VapC
MRYLFDTDTLSIWQLGTGAEFGVLQLRVSAVPTGDVGTSIVSFHEQYTGCHAYLNNARKTTDLIRGYERLDKVLRTFKALPVAQFDDKAVAELDRLRALNLRIGDLDLRIAAVALAGDLTVVTRNRRHFGKVPGLRIEDWTK